MIKEAMKFILDLKREPVIQDSNEREYILANGYNRIEIPKLEEQHHCTTLRGIIDYIKSNVDEDYCTNYLIHIFSPTEVRLYTDIDKDDWDRQLLIKTTAVIPEIRTDGFMDSEIFNIELLSKYVDTEHRSLLLQLVSGLQEESTVEVGDDGFSQKATVKSGIVSMEKVEIKNPFTLRPYRTFAEVQQPEGLFIFRIRQGGKCALFESGDSKWRLQAMYSIRELLENELEGEPVSIIM